MSSTKYKVLSTKRKVKETKRVVVAMSGGVDSSVAAALLKEKGYEVIGITLKLVPDNRACGSCCSAEAVLDAKKVAFKLNIPHYTINLKKEFFEYVIKDFCAEYVNGRTPNPCVRCNAYIKFGLLLQKALALKADYLATGHYAAVIYNAKTGRYILEKGKDCGKDQSYALYSLTQKQLKYSLFPLAKLKKEKVRKLAKRFGLLVAEKKDSQEICFIPDNNYARFLRENFKLKAKSGDIVDVRGEKLGKHSGIFNFTVGQRRGINIAAKEPLYVNKIDACKSRIIVGGKTAVFGKALYAEAVNLVAVSKLTKPMTVQVKTRYSSKPVKAVIKRFKNGVRVKFARPEWAISPGQAVVFYQGKKVLGGGIISGKLASSV
ncbi:MAG: tRNA 2-thiouridine(34) synthase MnmA [Candidatus Firestonebacteria bacterium]|nr:tRNA 2-thiouridine(34) synthase MnmA [Candidatus Firestonebacteria bacterium]